MLGFVDKKGVPNQLVSDSKPHLLSRCDLEIKRRLEVPLWSASNRSQPRSNTTTWQSFWRDGDFVGAAFES